MYGGYSFYFGHGKDDPSPVIDGERILTDHGYLTDLLTDKAIDELETGARETRPMFLSMHFNAVHWPWEAPGDAAKSAAIKSAVHRDGGSLETYRAMLESLDHNVGRVLDALERLGCLTNTLVVFTSDNGGERFSDMWPLTGMKGELLEGGIRVPVLARWPGRIAPGMRSDQLAATTDWLPTLLAAAGGAAGSRISPATAKTCCPCSRVPRRLTRARCTGATRATTRPRFATAAGSTCAWAAGNTCSTSKPIRASAPSCTKCIQRNLTG